MPENNQDNTPVTRALDSLNVPYRFFRHPGAVHSVEQAAQERGQSVDQVVRSLVFRLAAEEFVMVLMTGSRQVSWPLLRKHLGQSRLTLATEAEVKRETGYPLGAVSPFGLPAPMRVLVDESVLGLEVVSLGSGERGATVILTTEDLMKALGKVEVVKLA